MLSNEIVIDGSMGEGGGQILRTTLALAAVLGKRVKIINIRAKRPRPGLQRQHLTAVKAVATISNAKVEGLHLGSTTLIFEPRGLRGGDFNFDIGTAGSVTLVLQALLPILPFVPNPVRIRVRGGTDVPWSPPIDYVRHVLSRLLEHFGFNITVILKRRGHYPRGGGEIEVVVETPPGRLKPVELTDRGDIRAIEGISHCVKLPKHVAERQARAATQTIREGLRRLGISNVPINIELEWYERGKDPHLGPGSGVVVWALCENSVLGGDSLGAKGKPAEIVGREAAQNLVEDLMTGKALDRHASDMLIPFAALADGASVLGGAKLTLHAYTNIEVVKKLVPEASIEFVEGGKLEKPFMIQIKGVGLSL